MIPDWAGKYIGIPFVEKGEGFDGCNCWTLSRLVLRQEFAIHLPDYDTYETSTDKPSIETTFESAVDFWCHQEKLWKEVETPELGDLLFFRVFGFLHCGICLDETWALHVIKGANACLIRYRDQIWRTRFKEAYRYSGRSDSSRQG